MNKSYLYLSLLIGLWLSLAAQPGAAAPEQSPPAHDIRVLIDVSGSMKQNDPGNLRAPALRLLTGVLPSGTQAGVWTFARYVNMLVPYGAVNTAWREQARVAADRINSVGLYTDIEAALEKATWNWTAATAGTRRSLILLTDGLVDVSDDADADRRSRARVMDSLLPRLQRAGAAVYAIALSAGADGPLLQQLAAATGGGFEQADSADQLERIFFRMFEQAASPDTLPLTDNRILVDTGIEEITLLVFRRDHAPATTLTAPDGSTHDPARLPANARWHREARYDLVTIEKPMTGTWRVNAELDPDNRVMVVSNLRVVATQLPHQVLQGDAHDFLVRFTERDRAVARKEFLSLLKVRLLESGAGGEPAERPLHDNGRDGDSTAGDGIFGARLDTPRENGRRTLLVDVDGTTFRRQHRQEIEVVDSPVVADIRTDAGGPVLSVIPRAAIINPETLEVYATITDDGVLLDTRRLTRATPGEWRLPLDGYPPEGSYRLTLDIEGERPNGRPISYQPMPLHFGAAARPPAEAVESEADAGTDETDLAVEAEDTEELETADEDLATPGRTHWLLVAAVVVLLNLLLGGGLFLAYRKLFGEPVQPAAEEQAVAEAPAAAAAEAPAAPAAVFDHSQPSIVTQIAQAAAGTAAGTESMEAPVHHDAAGAAIDARTAEPAGNTVEPLAAPVDAPAGAEPLDSSPELVLADDSDQAAPEALEERLKNLKVEEIDLGFEEKARGTG